MIQQERRDTRGVAHADLVNAVRAAMLCGCEACRHTAHLQLLREQADDTFTAAQADLRLTKCLRADKAKP